MCKGGARISNTKVFVDPGEGVMAMVFADAARKGCSGGASDHRVRHGCVNGG
jgi:hypothetical protein